MTPSHRAVRLAAAFVLVAPAGCTSTSQIDTALAVAPGSADPAPLPAPARPGQAAGAAAPDFPAEPAGDAPVTTRQPPEDLAPRIAVRNTGTYPNINDERSPSLRQLSPGERAAMVAQMEALRQQHAAGRISTAEYQARLAYLQRLASSHSRDMLQRIEASP